MKAKFYVGSLKEVNGELEYKHLLCFSTTGDPHKYMDRLAKSWYEKGEKDGGGYYHRGGEVFVEFGFVTEVTEEKFNTHKEFITEL